MKKSIAMNEKHKCTMCVKGFNHGGSLVHRKRAHLPRRAMTVGSEEELQLLPCGNGVQMW